MSVNYTPRTQTVRTAYAWSVHDSHVPGNREYAEACFDNWMAAHDAEIIAQAQPQTVLDQKELRVAIHTAWLNGAVHPDAIADAVIDHLTPKKAS